MDDDGDDDDDDDDDADDDDDDDDDDILACHDELVNGLFFSGFAIRKFQKIWLFIKLESYPR